MRDELIRLLIAAALLSGWPGRILAEVPLGVTRLNGGEPLITASSFGSLGAAEDEGANINGPTVIRVPGWIPPELRADPAAVYYMYFAHHRGDYIRLAWSQAISGPWHLHQVGAGVAPGERGVLDLGSADAIALGNGLQIVDHVASPDAVVDEDGQRIVLYFHGPASHAGIDLGQKSFVATSASGLDFDDIEPVVLGLSYFRVFARSGAWFALARSGVLFGAPNGADPWSAPEDHDPAQELWTRREDNPFQADLDDAGVVAALRHVAVRRAGDMLQVFHTRIGDAPERILLVTIDSIAGDGTAWDPSFPAQEVLRADPGWEGGQLPAEPSQPGPAPGPVNQLRDPAVFTDEDGATYLFYAGGGESGIGVARIDIGPCADADADGTTLCNDCDDADSSVFPGAPQVCDGSNNDCDSPTWPALVGTNEADDDGDGVAECAGDCDDAHPSVHPGAPQICDGLNDDCDDPDWPVPPVDEIDGDGDGLSVCTGDCDDADPGIGSGGGAGLSGDGDGDGVRDGCDNCPDAVNLDQLDLDADGRGEACDNCPGLGNRPQTDLDLDGEGDPCDTDDGVIYLQLARDRLSWQAEQGFELWNVYRADYAIFLATGELTQPPGSNPCAWQVCGLSPVELEDDPPPALDAGGMALYLVSGTGQGGEGDLGFDSAGQPRPNDHSCP